MPSHDLSRRLFLGSLGATLALPELRGRAAQAPAAGGDCRQRRKGCRVRQRRRHRPAPRYLQADRCNNKRMAVIHFHGGGFAGGNKDGLAARLQAMSARGYTNIAAQYTAIRRREVAGADGGCEVVHPMDARQCLEAWNRSCEDCRVGIFRRAAISRCSPQAREPSGVRREKRQPGVPTDVAACLAYYAVTGPSWEGFRRQFPMPEGSSEEAWTAATPGTYIKSFPPTVLVPRARRRHRATREQRGISEQLRGANIPSELHTFAGVPHEFVGIPEFADATVAARRFLPRASRDQSEDVSALRRGSRWWRRRRGGPGRPAINRSDRSDRS